MVSSRKLVLEIEPSPLSTFTFALVCSAHVGCRLTAVLVKAAKLSTSFQFNTSKIITVMRTVSKFTQKMSAKEFATSCSSTIWVTAFNFWTISPEVSPFLKLWLSFIIFSLFAFHYGEFVLHKKLFPFTETSESIHITSLTKFIKDLPFHRRRQFGDPNPASFGGGRDRGRERGGEAETEFYFYTHTARKGVAGKKELLLLASERWWV